MNFTNYIFRFCLLIMLLFPLSRAFSLPQVIQILDVYPVPPKEIEALKKESDYHSDHCCPMIAHMAVNEDVVKWMKSEFGLKSNEFFQNKINKNMLQIIYFQSSCFPKKKSYGINQMQTNNPMFIIRKEIELWLSIHDPRRK